MTEDALGPRPTTDDDALEQKRVKAVVRSRIFGTETGPLKIGPYEIRRRIGSGAMGVVYEAWDPRLRRAVALKMLLTETDDDQRATRLIREAQALAQLRHPNVVGVYDVGTHEGAIYVVMELVVGETLDRWAAHAGPDVRQKVQMLIQIGRGLAAAHDRGLIHRDVKPDNVLVGVEGMPRLVDFGLSRLANADLLSSLAEHMPGAALDMKLTRTGTALGTPVYMSPEQLKGLSVDARSDQYAFGVMAYGLLYGELPFPADSIGALVEAVTNERIRTPTPRGEPTQVRRAILRTLSADPASRFPSMGALLAELDGASDAPPPAAPVRSTSGPRLGVLVALAIAALVVVGVVGISLGFILARSDDAPPTAPTASAPTAPTSSGPTPAAPVALPGVDAAMMPSSPLTDVAPNAPRPRVAPGSDVTERVARPSPTPSMEAPMPGAAAPTPGARSAPLREIRIGSTQNLWRNSQPMEAAARRLPRRVSNCFDPDWDYEGGGTQLGVYVTVEPSGHVTEVEVEDDDHVPERTRRCIGRVFRSGLGSLPATVRGFGGRVWYVIPFRPAG